MEALRGTSILLASIAASCSSQGPDAPAGASTRDAGLGRVTPRHAVDASSTDAASTDALSHDADPSSPSLEIHTRGSKSQRVPLVPPFSPGTHDYYVRCQSGANALDVSWVAPPGSSALLVQPVLTGSASRKTDPDSTSEYWVRCLPSDFPLLEMTLHPDAGTVTLGYYLLGNQTVPTGRSGYAMMLDPNGVPIWYYRQLQGAATMDVDSVIGDTVSFIPYLPDATFEIDHVATFDASYTRPSDDHELRSLSNGDLLVFQDPTEVADLTGLTLPVSGGGVEALGPNELIQACVIQETDASGNVVWQWKATDHFDPVQDMSLLQPAFQESKGQVLVQPFHCNSIDVAANGDLLVSARDMNSVFYVQKSTGKVLWKMGGSTYSKDGAVYVPVDDPFYGQHDARFLPGWSYTCTGGGGGQISLFDDETGETAVARAVVYDVTIAGGTAETDGGCAPNAAGSGATLAWQHRGAMSILETGSFRISPDGSRTIGWGRPASGQTVVFSEVDEAGRDLLDFYFPEATTSYRVIKVPASAFDLDDLRRSAGPP
jgi:Arylsulfotransferase (ASST)